MSFDVCFSSMAKAIPMVEKMISNLVEMAPRIPRWVLTSIKDPSSKLKRNTNDVKQMERGIRYLRFGGGGDPREAILKGVSRASLTKYKMLPYVTI